MDFYQPNSIYKSNASIEQDSLKLELFTLSGQEELIVDNTPMRTKEDDKVYAKKIQKKDGSFKYMIKTSKDGKLFNPVSIYGEEKPNTFLDSVCKSNEKFRTVSEKTFQWYIKFLTTKKENWLIHAEREAE